MPRVRNLKAGVVNADLSGLGSESFLYIGGFILIAGGLAYWAVNSRISETVDAAVIVAEAINPVDADNVFNSAVNAVGEAVSGEADWTLGGWFYDITHEQVRDPITGLITIETVAPFGFDSTSEPNSALQ